MFFVQKKVYHQKKSDSWFQNPCTSKMLPNSEEPFHSIPNTWCPVPPTNCPRCLLQSLDRNGCLPTFCSETPRGFAKCPPLNINRKGWLHWWLWIVIFEVMKVIRLHRLPPPKKKGGWATSFVRHDKRCWTSRNIDREAAWNLPPSTRKWQNYDENSRWSEYIV